MLNSHGFEQLDFEFDFMSESSQSCSLQWQNNHYFFGGTEKRQQVSMVSGNRLKRIGQLSFILEAGGCTVVNQSTIVLCFDLYQDNLCRWSNSPLGSFTELPKSNHSHRSTRIASFDGKNKILVNF